MSAEWVSCEFCGRDTKNKCRICRRCFPGTRHLQEHAAAAMGPLDEFDGESDYDYSEDAMGPHQAEDRMDAKWVDDDSEWRRA